jgi:Uri superfamily endonuclease
VEAKPGTYVLVLRCPSRARIQIGRWREIDLKRGYYCYVGSAFGPGGVRARVHRHFRNAKALHWHIDYLGEFTKPVCAWYSHAPKRLEHRWAALLSDMPGLSAIPGFGCSDCSCDSHLFFSPRKPVLKNFSALEPQEHRALLLFAPQRNGV